MNPMWEMGSSTTSKIFPRLSSNTGFNFSARNSVFFIIIFLLGYTILGRGIGMMNFPPRDLYSDKFAIISFEKFHASMRA